MPLLGRGCGPCGAAHDDRRRSSGPATLGRPALESARLRLFFDCPGAGPVPTFLMAGTIGITAESRALRWLDYSAAIRAPDVAGKARGVAGPSTRPRARPARTSSSMTASTRSPGRTAGARSIRARRGRVRGHGLLPAPWARDMALLHGRRRSATRRDRRHRVAVETLQDVTERKRAEEALRQTYAERLQRSNEELQRFAYVASHDLQEPLRDHLALSQLLERRYRGQLDQDADDYIGFIVDGGNRMQTPDPGPPPASRGSRRGAKPLEPTDAAAVVASVLRAMERPLAEAGATVTVGDMPAVMADAAQLEQVFANLVGNAVKYRRTDVPPEVRDLGAAQRRLVGVRGRGQRDRDRGGVPRPDLRDVPPPPHPRQVRGDRHRARGRQEDRRAARRQGPRRVRRRARARPSSSPCRPREPSRLRAGASSSTGSSALSETIVHAIVRRRTRPGCRLDRPDDRDTLMWSRSVDHTGRSGRSSGGLSANPGSRSAPSLPLFPPLSQRSALVPRSSNSDEHFHTAIASLICSGAEDSFARLRR